MLEVSVRVRVLKRDKNKAVYEVYGEDHTLGNLIEKTLLSDPRVSFASYENPHPLEDKIVITIVTREGAEPDNVLKDALKRIIEEAEAFKNKLVDVMKRAGLEVEE